MATNVDAKLLKQTKFPPDFSQKVDMKKVNVEVMKKWIAGKISEILGSDDDVVVELCFNLLEGSRFPDIKVLQIQLTGFLDKDTPKFCKELWTLCLSAQSNPQGVPKELLEAKKLELIQEKVAISTPKKPPRKPCVGKTKNACGTRMSTVYGKESEPSEVAVMEEAIGDFMIMTGVHPETPDLHLYGGNDLHFPLNIADLHHEITLTRIYLEAKTNEGVMPVPDHPQCDDLHVDLYPGLERRPLGDIETLIQRRDAAATVTADPHRRSAGVMDGIEGRDLIIVVVIELDPIHFQIRRAHDHPEDREGRIALRYRPVVLLLHPGHTVARMVGLRDHRRPCQVHVLARLTKIVDDIADREDLRLLIVMK
ncbi:MAG: hypothetical protein Q9168_003341 [Polycauliona sp. 1 TL-2023]